MDATPTDPDPGRDGRTGWWQCVAVSRAGTPAWLALVASDRYRDGERVELLVDAAEVQVASDAVMTAHFGVGGTRVERLVPGPRGASAAPPLWFLEVAETSAQPPAANLVAFTGHGQADGVIVDQAAVRGVPVTTADQVGAIRWYPASGEVDQVYVQPQWRRRSVSLALISGAAALSYARGWARLWGDGQRTELGETMRTAAPWRGRSADLTHLAPPMTPTGPAPQPGTPC